MLCFKSWASSVAIAFLAAVAGTATAGETCRVDKPVGIDGCCQYIGNRQPLAPSPFIKLPVGAIQPHGWLGRYMELQRDGLTGRLGTISKWLDKGSNAWLGTGTGYGWEEVPYWLRGYCSLAYILKDEAMIAEAQGWIEAIIASQREDGFFGPGNPDVENGFDLWPNMLVLFLMQTYYEHSGDERAISFMSRYFEWVANYPDEKFLKTYWENTRAGDMLYSCFWLYNITGNEQLIKVAEKIKRNAADWEQESSLPNFHTVNIAQCFRLPAEYWMLSGNEDQKAATYYDFWLIRGLCGQVPGGMYAADENARMGYFDPRQGSETCAIFEQMTSDMILVRVTGDAFWADHAEDVAFNTAPATFTADFKALRYITCPNQPISDHFNHHPGIDNSGPFMGMNPFSSRCCQHNHSHGWPYYMENLWLATPDGGLAAALYGASDVTAKVAGGHEVTISEETRYPFEETISFTVARKTGDGEEFPIYFRIPRWVSGMEVSVNGEDAGCGAINSESGPWFDSDNPGMWLKVSRAWHNGDVVKVSLPMHWSYRKWQQNKDCVSVNYGPLSFSLKIKERYEWIENVSTAMGDSAWQEGVDVDAWPAFDILPESDWNYGLLDPAGIDWSKLELIRGEWPADNFPWEANAVPLSVKLPGKKIPDWKIGRFGICAPVPFSPVKVDTPEEVLELIPMGAARLRISAFPVVK